MSLLNCPLSAVAASLRFGRNRDVPAGSCFNCEITCFEDCALKFDREILGTWGLLQSNASSPGEDDSLSRLRELSIHGGKASPAALPQGSHLVSAYVAKLRAGGKADANCPNRKKVGCQMAQQCRKKVASTGVAAFKSEIEAERHNGERVTLDDLDKTTDSPSRSLALVRRTKDASGSEKILPLEGTREKFFPVHPVAVGVFEHGTLKLDQCLTYCLASTCGCYVSVAGAEGPQAMKKHNEGNAALGTPVVDTKPTWHYEGATKEECGNGIKKVTTGLFVDFTHGVGGWLEVCTQKFWYHVFGSATHKDFKKWKEGCNSPIDNDWGCYWRAGRCEVGNRKYDYLLCNKRRKQEAFDVLSKNDARLARVRSAR